MLLHTRQIGEANVNEFNVVVLDELQNLGCIFEHRFLSLRWSRSRRERIKTYWVIVSGMLSLALGRPNLHGVNTLGDGHGKATQGLNPVGHGRYLSPTEALFELVDGL